MKKRISLIVFLSLALLGFSQERWISGTITDGSEPVQNVQIQIIDQASTVISDTQGKYRIVASPGDVLYYTSDGMEPIEIRVEDVTEVLNIDMFPKVEALQNVTVTSRRNNTQRELELLYPTNPNIIKTAFGYFDKSKASYAARILESDRILPGEFDLANVLRNRFPGITISDGLGFGRGPLEAQGTTLSGFVTGRAVFLRSSLPALFDVDGQLFTNFPDFIDVQNINRLAVIPSAAGTVKYGSLGRGGVIVINTKTGTPELRDKNGLPIDVARRTDNFYNGNAIKQSEVSSNAPDYLKELNQSTSLAQAKETYLRKTYTPNASPYFYLDSYRYFYDTWNDAVFADKIIEEAYPEISNNAVQLKSLAYIYEAQGRLEKANKIYKDVFILRPNYAQSYMDLANSNRNLRRFRKSANLYARYFYLVEKNFLQKDTATFSRMISRDFDNLLQLEKPAVIGSVSSEKPKENKQDIEGTRLVFEWSDSEAEFELQFVNPENQYYTWKHSLIDNAEIIKREKDLGYSASEYLIDNSLSGLWRVNIKYLGNKSLTPTYLKATLYHNYGTKSQRKETKVFKLDTEDVNRELFVLSKTSNTKT